MSLWSVCVVKTSRCFITRISEHGSSVCTGECRDFAGANFFNHCVGEYVWRAVVVWRTHVIASWSKCNNNIMYINITFMFLSLYFLLLVTMSVLHCMTWSKITDSITSLLLTVISWIKFYQVSNFTLVGYVFFSHASSVVGVSRLVYHLYDSTAVG